MKTNQPGYLLILLMTALVSCQKDQLATDEEVPDWLLERITQIESELRQDPQSSASVSAWIRYDYQYEYTYEFHNLLSSAWPEIYDVNGDPVAFSQDSFNQYQDEKCGKKYIWKGPAYFIRE